MTEHAAAKSDQIPLMTPEVVLLLLTWAIFVALLVILHKFAWKPILAGLDQREKTIRESLDQADQIQKQLVDIQTSKDIILSEARQAAQGIIDDSRKKAVEMAHGIEERAKNQAQDIISAAHQEIDGEKERVRATLRRESADIAVALASKILQENLDDQKNRSLIDQYIKEI